jgi:poly(A) polymerase
MHNLIDNNTGKIINVLLQNASQDEDVFLVGGIVRDLLLNKAIHDFDISFRGDVNAYAKRVADCLGASFFMLNEKFQTARIFYKKKTNISIDIVGMRGDSIEDDLKLRDFTINSMAIDLKIPDKLIDPCHGAIDLQEKRLRVCSARSFSDDPIRILRAIRQSIIFGLKIDIGTLQLLKTSSAELTKVTSERIRDELMRILDLPDPTIAVNILKQLKLIDLILPEVNSVALINCKLPNTNINLWENTIQTIKNLILLEHLLVGNLIDGDANSLRSADVVLKLGRFRNDFGELFQKSIHKDRSINSLLLLSCLFKNIDALNSDSTSNNFEQKKSSRVLEAFNQRAKELALSNKERRWGISVLNGQRIFHELSAQNKVIDGEDVYNYFRLCGESGIFACILAIADTLTMQLENGFEEIWFQELNLARKLLEGYWEKNNQWVDPPVFIKGHEILESFPGLRRDRIGYWLEKVKQSTAAGLIQNKKEAQAFLVKSISRSLTD